MVDDFLTEVRRRNASCDVGADELFGKAADCPWPMTDGPLYAFRVCLGMPSTCGGVRVGREPLGSVPGPAKGT